MNKLSRIAYSIFILKIEKSKIIPTTKNSIDCTNTIGIIESAYANMNSYDLDFDT